MSDEMNLMDLPNHMDEGPVDMASDPFDEVIEEGDFEETSEVDDIEASDETSEEPEDQSTEEVSEDSIEDSEEDGEEDADREDEKVEEKEEESEEEEISPEESLQALNEKIEKGELEIQIDEETSATIQDLKNSYIGQKEIARRFSEYDVKAKQLDKDTQEIEGYINEFASRLRDGDSVGAMSFFGEFAGVPPYMIKEQLVAALRPEIIRREQMTATDIQNEYLQSQNEYLTQQRESENELRSQEQANMELQNSINEIRETHNIDENTWEDAVSYLKETQQEGEELTPELVTDFIQSERNYVQAAEVVDAFEGQFDDKDKWVEELADIKEKYPHFTNDDLNDVLKAAYEQVSTKKTEEKLAKKIESKNTTSKKTKTKTQVKEDEDLDPELDDWL